MIESDSPTVTESAALAVTTSGQNMEGTRNGRVLVLIRGMTPTADKRMIESESPTATEAVALAVTTARRDVLRPQSTLMVEGGGLGQ